MVLDESLDGEEDTADEDDEEEGSHRAWRRSSHRLITQGEEEGGGGGGGVPTASGITVPKRPLADGGGESQRGGGVGSRSVRTDGSKGPATASSGHSARPASPRGSGYSSTSHSAPASPRGSPEAKKAPNSVRPPNVVGRAPSASARGGGPRASARPPLPSSLVASLASGSATPAGAPPAVLHGNGVGGIVGEGLGSGLAMAWARDYQQTSLVGIGSRSLVHEARRLGDLEEGEASHAAMCALVLDDAQWEVAREELKALGGLSHPNVMMVYGWYERRLPPAPPLHPTGSYEITVASQLMHGGDVLQKACTCRYDEEGVREVARIVCRALLALDDAGVRSVDVAPWTLMYELPSSDRWLHRGLRITNAGFGAPPLARGAEAPLRQAFEPPEVLRAGAPRDLTAAMYTLGRLLQLLLFGSLEGLGSAEAGEDAKAAADKDVGRGGGGGGGTGDGDDVSAEARAVIESLTRISPIARPKPDQLLQQAWLARGAAGSDITGVTAGGEGSAAAAGGSGGGDDPSSSPPSKAEPNLDKLLGEPSASPLLEANEKLNRWYDEFLFEGMTARLAEMADG